MECPGDEERGQRHDDELEQDTQDNGPGATSNNRKVGKCQCQAHAEHDDHQRVVHAGNQWRSSIGEDQSTNKCAKDN
ncbi:Uncharacterised protein [Chlamydia trachomatis]|nr:Uncharacterised protein [Chlamydia trachomatis]